jgi:U32 family peptidase
MNKNVKKPELLAPAGDFEKLKVAFHFGADAVYAGLKEFSLRANTKNFNDIQIKQAIDYTHDLCKKIYIAMNIYFFPEQSELIIENLLMLNSLKPDGIIISDLGLLYLIRKHDIKIPVHISTQANTTNQYAVEMYRELGVSRIVLARELSLSKIDVIKNHTKDIELETFIHGAMCISYSGRCLLSSYMTAKNMGKRKDEKQDYVRSANQGDCTHSCRWEYVLREKTRPDQDYEIIENEEGSYILSSKDICMIDNIKDLIEHGIDSFKIEGRMKSILYISSIVRAYRQAIDNYFDPGILYDNIMIKNEMNVVSHREFSTGYFYDSPEMKANVTINPVYKREMRLAALVEKVRGERLILKIFNTINTKNNLEYIGRNMKTLKISKIVFYDNNGSILDKANHNQYIEAIIFDGSGKIINSEIFDIIRMESDF